MRFAVADKDCSVRVHENPVGPRHATFQRSSSRTVTSFASSGDQFQGSLGDIDHPHRVAFGVGEVYVSVGSNTQTLWSGESRLFRRTIVSSEAFLTRARGVMNYSGPEIEFVNCVAFTQREPQIAVRIKIERTRPVQRCSLNLRTVGCGSFVTRSRKG